jgi:PAS domain S-box-containing protein
MVCSAEETMTDEDPSRTEPIGVSAEVPACLVGGGEMGALMRVHDWSSSPLGPPQRWPQSLRTVVRLMLNTGHPMYIWWGPEKACLYNDAYRESIGSERHPASLGRPATEVWAEIWDIIGPQIEQVMSGGGATWNVDHLVPITRNGRREEVYWTYSYSPIDDEGSVGGIGGVLVVCTETTRQVATIRQVRSERDRLAQLFEQSPTFMALLEGPQHRIAIANPGYMRLIGERDVLGRTVQEALPDAVEQGYLELLDQVFASGEAFSANGSRYVQVSDDGTSTERFVDFVVQPIKDTEGAVTGIFVQGVDVTDRTLAYASLRASEARFRAALTAGLMGSWETDHATKTRQWSKEGMALFGLDLPDGVGHVGGTDDEFINAIHPDDRHTAARFRELADRQDSFPAEYRIVRRDGKVLWLSGRGLVIARDASGNALRLVNIMADATERKTAEEQLRIERERLRLALSAGQMGAYDLNIADDLLWWSPEMYALFGVDPASFVPTRESVGAFIHPDDRDEFTRLRGESIAQHQPFVHEFRIRRPQGDEAWLAHRGQAEYDAEGRPLRNFGITMDITDRKEVEQQLRNSDRQKDNFIATLAHELRNPLAPIRSAAQLLRRLDALDPKVAWCHDVIERQLGHVSRLLDDLLDVSRLNRGELHLRRQRLDLGLAIQQAVEIAQPAIQAGSHALVAVPANEPVELDGDLTRLAQIFSNVLINAAKYTPSGGKISLTVERQGGEAVVTISDTGIGIATEHHARIFEMFGQVGAAAPGAQGGQGIGLSLTKALVEMHGGTISVRSDGVGQGSTFEVRLPLLSPDLSAAARPETTPTVAAQPGDVYRVLIADDSTDVADAYAWLLRDMGHEVHVSYDGEQAFAMAQALRPDIALLDLGMPKLDGYALCRQIRATPWGGAITLVAQTGWGQEDDRRKTRDAGFDHHLVKPVEPDEIIALFKRRTTWR